MGHVRTFIANDRHLRKNDNCMGSGDFLKYLSQFIRNEIQRIFWPAMLTIYFGGTQILDRHTFRRHFAKNPNNVFFVELRDAALPPRNLPPYS